MSTSRTGRNHCIQSCGIEEEDLVLGLVYLKIKNVGRYDQVVFLAGIDLFQATEVMRKADVAYTFLKEL